MDTPQSAADRDTVDPTLDRPLRVDGFRGTPAEIERQWFEEVYRGRGDVMASCR
jgi:hypothetical protein